VDTQPVTCLPPRPRSTSPSPPSLAGARSCPSCRSHTRRPACSWITSACWRVPCTVVVVRATLCRTLGSPSCPEAAAARVPTAPWSVRTCLIGRPGPLGRAQRRCEPPDGPGSRLDPPSAVQRLPGPFLKQPPRAWLPLPGPGAHWTRLFRARPHLGAGPQGAAAVQTPHLLDGTHLRRVPQRPGTGRGGPPDSHRDRGGTRAGVILGLSVCRSAPGAGVHLFFLPSNPRFA
jgi:hypothetical protein